MPLVMSPLEFLQQLAAPVLKLRLHPIWFHGVLAPNAKLRDLVMPQSAYFSDRGRLFQSDHGRRNGVAGVALG